MAKSKAKQEKVPEPEADNKIESDKAEKSVAKTPASGSNRGAWIMALIIGAFIIVALGYGYNTITQKNMMKKACSDVSNSPDLKYPTVCVPLAADSNSGDYVDTRSIPMCRCKVDLGNGTSTIIDVRAAK